MRMVLNGKINLNLVSGEWCVTGHQEVKPETNT